LENAVLRSWISESVEFNESDKQINSLIEFKHAQDHEAKESEKDAMDIGNKEGRVVEGEEAIAILDISRKIIEASSWDGDKESKLCIIKYLTSSLSSTVEE
jgi:hypothetical protein